MRYSWHTMLPERAFRAIGGKMTYEGGRSGGGTSTTITQNFSPEEAARRAQVMDEATRIYGATKDVMSSSRYPGSAPVPFSPESVQAQQMAVTNALNAQPSINAIQQGVQFGLSDVMDVNSNPYLQSAIAAAIQPITQSYSGAGGVLSNIRSGANEAGQYGGSRQGIAEGIAASQYMGAVGNTAAKMASEGYQRGLDTFEKTLMFSPQALDATMLPVSWLSGVGAQKENLAQGMADYQASGDMWQLNAPWLGLQNYANIVFGGGSNGGTSTSSSSGFGNSRSGLMGGLSGAAAGFSLSGGNPLGAAVGALIGLLG